MRPLLFFVSISNYRPPQHVAQQGGALDRDVLAGIMMHIK